MTNPESIRSPENTSRTGSSASSREPTWHEQWDQATTERDTVKTQRDRAQSALTGALREFMPFKNLPKKIETKKAGLKALQDQYDQQAQIVSEIRMSVSKGESAWLEPEDLDIRRENLTRAEKRLAEIRAKIDPVEQELYVLENDQMNEHDKRATTIKTLSKDYADLQQAYTYWNDEVSELMKQNQQRLHDPNERGERTQEQSEAEIVLTKTLLW